MHHHTTTNDYVNTGSSTATTTTLPTTTTTTTMAPRTSRSKSPAAKSAGGFDPMDYKDDAIALALLAGLAHLGGLNPLDPATLGSLLIGGGKALPVIGQSTVVTLHTLNICQGRGKKFWLTDLMECVAGVFAAGIALALLNGGSLGDALMGGSEGDYTFVAICWYLQNHSIAGAVPNVWDMVTASPLGAPLQKCMSLATLCFVNSVIMQAASGDVSADALNKSNIALTPLVKAALVAGATSAIPAKPTAGATTSSAMVIAVLISTSGLSTLPVVGETIGSLTSKVTALVPLGGDWSTIYTNLVIVNAFLGDILASVGVPAEILDPVPLVTGLVNQVLQLKN